MTSRKRRRPTDDRKFLVRVVLNAFRTGSKVGLFRHGQPSGPRGLDQGKTLRHFCGK